ncbi:MAG TPA: hypothetical protein VM822_17685 [Pseudolabrys sp.]|nr:hypothetical protein [Pseudolabrys sp.]
MLSVTDGTALAGHIVPRDGAWFAFNFDDTLIGKFSSQHQAVCAIPITKENPAPAMEDRRGEKVVQGGNRDSTFGRSPEGHAQHHDGVD